VDVRSRGFATSQENARVFFRTASPSILLEDRLERIRSIMSRREEERGPVAVVRTRGSKYTKPTRTRIHRQICDSFFSPSFPHRPFSATTSRIVASSFSSPACFHERVLSRLTGLANARATRASSREDESGLWRSQRRPHCARGMAEGINFINYFAYSLSR
jgi:hypothetical protein